MNKKSKFFNFVITMLLLLFLIPASSYALTFSYGGDIVTFDGLDWAPGNALAVGAVPLSEDSDAKTSFDILYQASLSSFTLGNNSVGASNLNSTYEVTVVAGAREEGFRFATPYGQTAKFEHDPNGQTNFFEIWVGAKNSNPLAGTGYNDGSLILSGTVIDGSGNFTVDLLDDDFNPIAPVALDNFDSDKNGPIPEDNYPGIMTLLGSGKTDAFMTALISSIDSSIILGTIISMDLSLRTDNATPFRYVDPSAQLYNGNGYTTPTFGLAGTLNGAPSTTGEPVDFLFEADGRSTITATVVPEPTTLLLLGFGMIGIAGLARNKKNS